ncbi:MAG: hypothetical protein AB7T63_13595 [Planctomycetota bacterium]
MRRRIGRRFARASSAVALLALLVVPVAAAPQDAKDPAADHPARRAAREAIAAGRLEEARKHLAEVMGDYPSSPAVLLDAVRAAADAPEQLLLAWDRWATAVADKAGRIELGKEAKGLAGADDGARREVEKARARAAADVVKAMGSARGPAAPLVVKAYDLLLDDVLEGATALEDEHRDARAKARAKAAESAPSLVDAITKAAGRGSRPEQARVRFRLGRALLGLAAQSRYKLPDGPDKGGDVWSRLGERLVREAEVELAAAQMEPLTLEALEAMDADAIAAFNKAHADLATPGRSITPKGRYEIVTASGHGVLLNATRQAEVIHDRLARWFGSDPFENKRGLIRIVSSWAELERENAPYWWAKGFQQGSITRIHVALESPVGMVRTLAHELTHRFDGAFHAGQPAWMSEGRAVYAEGAFEQLDTPDMDPLYADGGRIGAAGSHFRTAWWLGSLVSGALDDYRENYTAGHALWTYLSTWPPGETGMFRAPLEAWMTSFSGSSRDAVADFTARFCDGKDGRPEDFEGFAAAFGAFLDGFHADPAPPWKSRYRLVNDTRQQTRFLDAPALPRTRDREEPRFGQDHLVEAARALADLGEAKVAIALLAWGLAWDEILGEDLDLLLRLLVGEREEAAAAYIRRERERHAGVADPEVVARVDATALGRPLLTGFLRQVADAAVLRDGQGAAHAAARFARLHDRVAAWVGAEPLDLPVAQVSGLPTRLDAEGWTSAKLVRFEGAPAPDRWMVTPERDLVVGRKEAVTAGPQRDAPYASVFVRSNRTARADVRLRLRLHFLTPHVEGAIVVGHERYDRNVQIRFRAGEAPREGMPPLREVLIKRASWSVTTLRPYDDVLGGWSADGMVSFAERNRCDVVVDIRGTHVTCWVDGIEAGRLADAQGRPVDGHVGFAVLTGAIRVESATLEDLVGPPAPDASPEATPSLARPRLPMGRWAMGRVLEGLPIGPHGRIVLWLPWGAHGEGKEFLALEAKELTSLAKRIAGEVDELHHEADLVAVVPAAWPETARASVAAALEAGAGPGRTSVFEHAESPGACPAEEGWGRSPVYLFVDDRGIVRCVDERGWPTLKERDGSRWNPWYRWMRYTRGW